MEDPEAVQRYTQGDLWDFSRRSAAANWFLSDPSFVSKTAAATTDWGQINDLNRPALVLGAVGCAASRSSKAFVSPQSKKTFCKHLLSAIDGYDSDGPDAPTVEAIQPLLDAALPWLDDDRFVDEATVEGGIVQRCSEIICHECIQPRPYGQRNQDTEPDMLQTCMQICACAIRNLSQRETYSALETTVKSGGFAAVVVGSSRRCCGPLLRASALRAVLAVSSAIAASGTQNLRPGNKNHEPANFMISSADVAPLFVEGTTRDVIDRFLLEYKTLDPIPELTTFLSHICIDADKQKGSQFDRLSPEAGDASDGEWETDDDVAEEKSGIFDSVFSPIISSISRAKEVVAEAAVATISATADSMVDSLSKPPRRTPHRAITTWKDREEWVTTDEEASDDGVVENEVAVTEHGPGVDDDASYADQLSRIALSAYDSSDMSTLSPVQDWILAQVLEIVAHDSLREYRCNLSGKDIFQCKVTPSTMEEAFNMSLEFWGTPEGLMGQGISKHIVDWAQETCAGLHIKFRDIGSQLMRIAREDCAKWKHDHLSTEFYIVGSCDQGTQVLPVNDVSLVYLVAGHDGRQLADRFDSLPVIATLTLLPFDGRITWAGVSAAKQANNKVPQGELHSWLEAALSTARKNNRIFQSLGTNDSDGEGVATSILGTLASSPTEKPLPKTNNDTSCLREQLQVAPTTRVLEQHGTSNKFHMECSTIVVAKENETYGFGSDVTDDSSIDIDDVLAKKYKCIENEKKAARKAEEERLEELFKDFDDLADPFRYISPQSDTVCAQPDDASEERSSALSDTIAVEAIKQNVISVDHASGVSRASAEDAQRDSTSTADSQNDNKPTDSSALQAKASSSKEVLDQGESWLAGLGW